MFIINIRNEVLKILHEAKNCFLTCYFYSACFLKRFFYYFVGVSLLDKCSATISISVSVVWWWYFSRLHVFSTNLPHHASYGIYHYYLTGNARFRTFDTTTLIRGRELYFSKETRLRGSPHPVTYRPRRFGELKPSP